MADEELFADLPEQGGPAPARGAPRLLTAERRQVMLRAVDLDGLVAADDSVRDVWAFVESLETCRKQAQQLVRRLKRELQEDPAAGERRRQAARGRAASERLRRVEAALRTMGSRESASRAAAKARAPPIGATGTAISATHSQSHRR